MRGHQTLTIDEVAAALRPIGIDPSAVALVQPLGATDLYVLASSKLGMPEADLLKAVSRAAGARVQSLKAMPDSVEAVMVRAGYRLSLVPTCKAVSFITTKDALRHALQAGTMLAESASQASAVFKAGTRPMVPFRLLKGPSEYERIVSGVVLAPEAPDGTKTEESDADIYSEEEIWKAMCWWMENAGSAFSYHHVDMGGRPLSNQDVVILENAQAKTDFQLGEQLIAKGTWWMTTRVNNEQLWQDILAGNINSWSIGAWAMGEVEQATTATKA